MSNGHLSCAVKIKVVLYCTGQVSQVYIEYRAVDGMKRILLIALTEKCSIMKNEDYHPAKEATIFSDFLFGRSWAEIMGNSSTIVVFSGPR